MRRDWSKTQRTVSFFAPLFFFLPRLSSNHFHLLPDFYREIPPKVASGEIKYREDIKHGLHSVPQAIYDVQTGKNEGKSIVMVADA